jgi:uncharacterized protein with PhoU and TrkA domain
VCYDVVKFDEKPIYERQNMSKVVDITPVVGKVTEEQAKAFTDLDREQNVVRDVFRMAHAKAEENLTKVRISRQQLWDKIAEEHDLTLSDGYHVNLPTFEIRKGEGTPAK